MTAQEKMTFKVAEELTEIFDQMSMEQQFNKEDVAEVATFFLAMVGTGAAISGASAEFADCKVKWFVDEFEEEEA